MGLGCIYWFFFLSCSSVTLSPLHSCPTGFHSLLTHVATSDHEKSKMRADAACCEEAACTCVQRVELWMSSTVPCVSHIKGICKEHHMNQRAKRPSHRRAKRSPKTGDSQRASLVRHCLTQENCPYSAQQEEPQGNHQSPVIQSQPLCKRHTIVLPRVQCPRQVRSFGP